MAELNCTKEDWKVVGPAFVFSTEKPPRLIADVGTANFSLKETEANDHLIAAAPDMYRALMGAAALLLSEGYIESDIVWDIKQALAKAEGKESHGKQSGN
jgi:hypothetical protein